MSGLRELQKALSLAIVGSDHNDAEAYIVPDGFSAAARLNIYRNTFVSTLTSALRITHPAVQRLVGAEFFDGAARHFIDRYPPQSAYLDLYGAGFAQFLEQFPPAMSLDYLADVARLEWAVNGALHAKDALPLNMAHLEKRSQSAQAGLRLIPHHSVHFVRSIYPVDVLWRAVLAEDDLALAKIDLAAGPVWLMIARLGDAVDVTRLGESEWHFTAALCDGESLASVLRAAEDGHAPVILARHLANGLFVDFQLSDDEDIRRGERT